MEPLIVDTRTTDSNAVILEVRGEMRIDCTPLEVQIRKIVAQHPQLVVVDLSGLSFISSLGMGCFVSLRKGLATWGGKVRVAAARPMVKDALSRARLLDVMEHADTVDAALA